MLIKFEFDKKKVLCLIQLYLQATRSYKQSKKLEKKKSMRKVFHFPPVFFYFLLSELLFNDQSAVKPIVYSIFCMTGPMILNISAISEWLDKWTHAPRIQFFFS